MEDRLEEQLEKLVEWIDEAEESLEEYRDLSERCRDYYDGDQWTDAEIETLERRKQPVITINRIAPKVNYLIGMEAEFRQDPKAYPRTKQHEQAAEACTDALRYVADNVEMDQVASACFLNLLVEGSEAAEVVIRPTQDDIEIQIKHLQWDRLIYDHHSRAKDFSDAKFLGGVHWMDKADALEMWPDAEETLEAAFSYDTVDDTYDDTPREWVDSNRKRVKICYLYWRSREGWDYGIFTKGGWLKEAGPSPYRSKYGTECPIVAQSCFVDRNGGRYGVVKNLLDIQDEINKRRSKALHMMSTRQTYSSKQAAGEDIDKIKRELARADGHLEFEYGTFGADFGILPNAEMVQTQFALLAEAKTEIDAIGANAAMSGDEERSMSGRALQTRQKGGSLEVAVVFDMHRAFKRRIYRAIWNRIRQFWRAEKWIRITDNEDNLKWVGLNRPVTLGEVMQKQGTQIPPQMMQDPRLQIPVSVENQVAEIDVDIVLDETQDVVTLQAEQFQVLADLYQANPQAIPFEALIEASTLRSGIKRAINEAKEVNPQMVQQQQLEQQMRVAAQQAEIAKTKAQAAKDMSQVHENQADIQKTIAEAEKTLLETRQMALGIR